jgi:small subunit ribosomal protein S6
MDPFCPAKRDLMAIGGFLNLFKFTPVKFHFVDPFHGVKEKLMKSYEMMYVISGDVQESELKKIQKKVLSLIENTQSKVIKENFWGKKHLAYSIQKQDYGFYVLVLFKAMPDKLGELEDKIKLTDEIIRYLLTKEEMVKPKKPKKPKIKKALEKPVKKVSPVKKPKVKEIKVEKPKLEKPEAKPEKLKVKRPKSKKPKALVKKEKKEIAEEKEREEVLDKKLEEILEEEG